MANIDKNIIITPSIGSTNTDPKIDFFGASSTVGPSTISLKIYPLNSGTLSFEASAGQLFSIVNNLTSGSIFSVNDTSGIPSIDVNADGTVNIASYGGSVGIGTLIPTSKLHVVGDVTATSYKVPSGTSSQFLKANGTTDGTNYSSVGRSIAMSMLFGG